MSGLGIIVLLLVAIACNAASRRKLVAQAGPSVGDWILRGIVVALGALVVAGAVMA